MSHSKRNTSRAVFTSHERELAKSAWNSTSARLSRDSFLPFASCRLCLQPAVSPVSCLHGDIFCKECALSNILSQKKEIKRLEKARGKDEQDAEDELLRIAREERLKARKAIDEEKASKLTLPSFWVPSITPSSNTSNTLHTVVKKAKLSPVCPASQANKPHNYSLHTLVEVKFTEEKDASSTKTSQRICPSCKKALSNTSKAMLAKPCGHVLCKSCVSRFMTPTGAHDPHAPEVDHHTVACYVCDTDLTEKKAKAVKGSDDQKADKEKIRPGLVELKCEGTGFASGGVNVVDRIGVSFQC
ncbi:zinc finger containing protein [Diplocarpon rosae]|nr:zinc finger containing protein [Diplocarpon rosae]